MFQFEFAGRQVPAHLSILARWRALIVNQLSSGLEALSGELGSLRVREGLASSGAQLRTAVARFQAHYAHHNAALEARMRAGAIASWPHLRAAADRNRVWLTAVDSWLAEVAGRVRARLAPHAEAALIQFRTREFRVAATPYLAIVVLSVAAGLMIATAV